MRRDRVFPLTLLGFLLLLALYGVKRCTLGVDFTDEGAYLAWPLRVALGEPPFAGELLTLLRPVEVFLYLPFKLHPEMTLYEFRLLGWTIHVLSFATLALFLFRLTQAPLLSVLIAGLPLFICHIFGLATPSYNSLSSDFLLLTLSLKGLATTHTGRVRWGCELAGGVALFVATLSHPALGIVAAALLGREILIGGLVTNLARRRLTAANASLLLFIGCWVAFAGYLFASGALEIWLERFALVRSLSAKSLPRGPVTFLLQLTAFPFVHSRIAVAVAAAAAAALVALGILVRRQALPAAGDVAHGLALVLVAAIVATFRFGAGNLTTTLVLGSLLLIMVVIAPFAQSVLRVEPDVRFFMLLSGLGAFVYAVFTFYFSPHRSWVSGCLALPFAFATGLALLVRTPAQHASLSRLLLPVALALAAADVARNHYEHVQRDAPPAFLQASFQLPKLRAIKSTAERVQAVEELHAYLRPRLAPGQSLLVYDDCPMLYYLLDARPAYGLAWAVRYSQSAQTLRQLDAELRAKPLPDYAIRTLVDVSAASWSHAEPVNYDHYPLNETVVANYQLEKTIFPFEIWRLRSPTRADAAVSR